MTESELKVFYSEVLEPQLKKIEVKRQKAANEIIIGACCGIIGLGLAFLTFKFEVEPIYTLPFAFTLVISAIYLLINGNSIFSQYKHLFKQTVVKQIVNALNPDWKYFHDRKIKRSDFDKSGLLRSSYSKYEGDDLVVGQIDKTKFYSSELDVEKKVQSGDDTRYETLFKGLFFFADFNKHIKSETYLFSKDSPDQKSFSLINMSLNFFSNKKGESVKMENTELNNLFDIYADDQQEARYVLTPNIVESIISFKKKLRSPINFAFKGSRVYCSIQFGMDLFEPKLFSSNVKYEDVRFMTFLFQTNQVLVRELNLNTRIWTKE